eukprot:gene29219-38706_t
MEELVTGGVSGAHLRQFIERIENLEHEKAELAEQIRDAMAEAKAEGFDVKTLRQLIRIRKMKKEELAEQEEFLIEMALVLSIIGIISAYAIPALLQARTSAKYRETETKLESVIYALAGFIQVHHRLPSPANPAAKGQDSGIEQRDLTTGILPYRTLGIQENDAKDGFRHWISYSASLDATADSTNKSRSFEETQKIGLNSYTQDASNSFCYIRPHHIRLDVRNAQGQPMLATGFFDDFIAFVLVSHGPSGAGSFNDSGNRQPATGDKLKNLGGTSFIDQPITKEYDDRVRWNARTQFRA